MSRSEGEGPPQAPRERAPAARFATVGVLVVGFTAYVGFQRACERWTGELPSDLLAAVLGAAVGGGAGWLLLRRQGRE